MDDARKNNQVIRQGESELVRKVLKIEHSEFSPEKLQEFIEMRGRLLGRKDAKENRKVLVEVEKQIDNLLFIPDLVSIKFDDPRHYVHIVEKGLTINGKKFVRLLCGAGMARASTAMFVNQEIEEELQSFLNCGRDMSVKMNPNKFSAYISLASSATSRVSTPIFCVVPDKVIKRTLQTDYIIESPSGKDSVIEPRDIEIDVSLFDGQGLIDPSKAQDWIDELLIEYLPSAFIFRAAFSKGLLVSFPFKRVAEERGIDTITDIYGNTHSIFDIDVLLSESQFKMASGYKSIEQFRQECKVRDFGWGISRISPRQDKTTANLNYQYIQALRLSSKDIPVICKETVDWISSVQHDYRWALLFLLGEVSKEKVDIEWFSKLSDPIIKAILLNPECINDLHIINYIERLIRKISTEAKMGTLRVPGNYSFLTVDPYAQTEHILGLPVKGIVKQGHIYSNFWNKKNENEVAVLRSPTTWASEVVRSRLQNDSIVNDYFKEQYSGLVFNIYDNYLLQLSGADVDGDIALSTNVLNNYIHDQYRIPSYDRKTADKKEIDFSTLYKSDIASFGSHVGLLTNAGACLFGMLSLYSEDSIEYKTIINRLKISNAQQQMLIDGAKGIVVQPFPRWWLDKLTDDQKENLSEEEIVLYEKLRIKSRPYFMRFLYPTTWGKKYSRHQAAYENLINIRFGLTLRELLEKQDKSELENKMIEDYYKYSPLMDSLSPMNQLSHHIENEVAKIKKQSKNINFDWTVYLDSSIELDQSKLDKMRKVYLEFSTSKRNNYDTGRKSKDEKEDNLLLFRKKLYEISSSLSEITNLAIIVSYGEFGKRSKDFCWRLIPQGLIFNLNKNNITRTIEMPTMSENGSFSYLNKNYEFYTLEI